MYAFINGGTVGPFGTGGSGSFTALTGDATSTSTGGATTVLGINGTPLSGLATGILKNTTTTGVPSIAGSADILAACTTCVTSASALTSNSVVLGGGLQASKTVAGITTDGTSVLTLGVAGISVGGVALKNATSGTITINPPTGALGTVTVTIPAATDTLVNLGGTQSLTSKTLDGVTPTTMGYVDPTSSIQTQLNAKQASLSLVAGTYVNGDLCSYASSGTLLNCNTSPSGGGGTSTFIQTAPGFGNGGSVFTTIANNINIEGSIETQGGVFNTLKIRIQADDLTGGDLYDVGLYGPNCIAGSSCSLAAHIGATAIGATGLLSASLVSAPVTLAAGQYWICTTGNATTAQYVYATGGPSMIIPFSTQQGTATTSSGGALPSSITMSSAGTSFSITDIVYVNLSK
jgi:hypothetical protein